MSDTKIGSVLSGVAGEYFVAGELSKRGYIASITLRNTKGVDIVCSNSEASKTVSIQVKTNRRSDTNWVLNKKAEDYYADNLFYVFVNLNLEKDGVPAYYVVPSKFVADHARTTHQQWLDTPNRNGGKHNDNTMRKFSDPNQDFLDRWDLLELG